MAEACVLSSHIAFHAFTLTSSAVTPSAAGSNPAAGAWPDRQRRPHPRFVQLSWGVGTMGAITCCHGAQRSGSYQSISYQSRSKGGTDEGDSAALAFRSELSDQGRRHEGDDAWRPGGGGGVPSGDGERDVEGAGDPRTLGVRFTELVGRFVSEVASPVLEAMPGDAFHQGAAAQLTHMVKTRDGGETIRIIKTLAVKGRL